MQLVTRKQLGWPASAAPDQATTKGVKVHYVGDAVSKSLTGDHAKCLALWKSIRKAHLANTRENYSDVAYNYAACVHGYLLEGRGLRKRTGANGNQTLNKAHYAVLGLLGDEGLTKPTDEMLHAIRDGIDLLRKNGAGKEVKGHRDGYATSCPGAALYAWVEDGAPRPEVDEPEQEEPPSSGGTYTVRRGDTLYGIAREHGTTVDALVKLNGLTDPSALDVGQKLKLPAGASQPRTYTVAKGDTLWSIAAAQLGNGRRYTEIARLNGLGDSGALSVGQTLKIPAK